MPDISALNFPALTVITCQQSMEGKILVQIRPVNPKRGNLNPAQLLRGPLCEPGIAVNSKTNFIPALHRNDYLSIPEDGRTRAIG